MEKKRVKAETIVYSFETNKHLIVNRELFDNIFFNEDTAYLHQDINISQ